MRILKEPKNSLLHQYEVLFQLDGVELIFDEDAIEAIAEKSLKRKTGARGLRAIVEKVLLDLMYRVPSEPNIASCRVTKEVVEKDKDVEVEYNRESKTA